MKTVPKHIREKVARMNRLMDQIVAINIEIEEWAEKNGAEYAFGLSEDNRDDRGYGVWREDEFIKAIESSINGGTEE